MAGAKLVTRIQRGRYGSGSRGPGQNLSAQGGTLAKSLERFLSGNERVEGRGKKDPDVSGVVEGDIAGCAEENEVFERIEIRQLGKTTALELAQLGAVVRLGAVLRALADVPAGGPQW